ncbi:MAG: PAS domain S-box protein [SAR324 cluster bacterium]|nr:PAS domain S-box protein [SAR324 cluster bacterium]
MTIKKKLFTGFLILSVLAAIEGFWALRQLQYVSRPLSEDIPLSIEQVSHDAEMDSLAQTIRYYDEVLTNSARNFAFTGIQKWKQRYYAFEPLLDQAIQQAIDRGDEKDQEIYHRLKQANNLLVDMEHEALEQALQGHLSRAVEILENRAYREQKWIFEGHLREYFVKRGVQYEHSFESSLVTIRIAARRAQQTLQNSLEWTVTFVIFILFLASAIGVFITRSIVTPIMNLVTATQQICDGDFSHRVAETASGEIGILSRSFNQMTDSLVESNRELQNAKEQLEIRVTQRTLELKQANERLQHEIMTRQEIAEDLREHEIHIRTIVDNIVDGIITINAYGLVESMNHAAERIFGYSAKEVISNNISMLMPEPYQSEHDEYMKLYRESGKARVIGIGREVEGQRKDGTIFPMDLAVNEIYIDGKQLFTGIIRDITERKQSERKIIQAQKDAEQYAATLLEYAIEVERKNVALDEARQKADLANKAKSQFLANMSHEIRTPMNAVIGFSELLSTLIVDKTQKTYIESVQTAGNSLLTIINDILDLSKIESGMMRIQYEAVALPSVIDQVDQIFRLILEGKQLEFLVELDPKLPAFLMLDEVRIRQTLINLIGNSVKFTEKGHIKLFVKTENKTGCQDKVDLYVSVEDTGIGIPQHQQELIFESFRQQDSQSTRKFGGTGLGLSLTKKLVNLMNGTLTVSSIPDQGSVFTIQLRDVEIPDTAKFSLNTSLISAERQFYFGSKRVLVVDDLEPNRFLVRESLKKSGVEVLEAENGQKALLVAREYHPDVILMDIRMPVMDGHEATKKLKGSLETADIPVIALTASIEHSEISRLQDSGFDGYLPKPLKLNALLEELSRFLKNEFECSPTDNLPKETSSPAEHRVITPELLERLENEIWKQWEVVKLGGVFDTIQIFAGQLLKLGEDNAIRPLREFGETLQSHAENFDVEHMNITLASYPNLLEKLKKQSQVSTRP